MDELAQALGRISSGLYILTARQEKQDGHRQTGMLVSFVMQVSFQPPLVTVAVGQGRPMVDWLRGGATAALNVLGTGHKSTVSHFGRGFAPEEDAFTGVALVTNDPAPILADACAFLTGRVEREVLAGDHILFLLAIDGGGLLHPEQPMVHFRKNGFRY